MEAVLLDLDNTMILFDEGAFYENYFERLSPWFKDLFTPAQLREKVLRATFALRDNNGRVCNRDRFLDVFAADCPHLRDEYWKRFQHFYETDFDWIKKSVRLPRLLTETLERLSGMGLRLVVASNPVFPRLALVKRMGWAGIDPGRFSLLTHLENMSYVKPRVEYYRQICEMIGTHPERCMMVGNDPGNDMVAARAGLKTYLTDEVGSFDYSSLTLNDRDRQDSLVPPDYTGPFADVVLVLEEDAQRPAGTDA